MSYTFTVSDRQARLLGQSVCALAFLSESEGFDLPRSEFLQLVSLLGIPANDFAVLSGQPYLDSLLDVVRCFGQFDQLSPDGGPS